MQRQVGQHDAVAVRELVDDRLPLAVGQSPCECSSASGGSGPGLAIRDPRAVGVVVQPQLHCAPQLSTDTLARRGRRGVDRPAGPPSRGRADPVAGAREFLDDVRLDGMAAHGVRAQPARARAGAGVACRGALWTAADLAGRAVPARVDAPPGLDGRRRAAPAAGRRSRCATSASRSRPWSARRARWPRTPPSASRSTTSRCRAGRRPARRPSRCCAGSSGRATSRARSRRAAHVVAHRARDPAPGGGADGAARRARRSRRRAADRLVVVAERAPRRARSSRRCSAADERAIRVIVPDVGGGFGSKGTLPVETPLVALAALAARAAGQVGRGPARELPRRAAGPRACARRSSSRSTRDGRILALRGAAARRPRRLPAAEHRDPAAHDGDAAQRLLRHPGGRGRSSPARARTRCRPRPTAAPGRPEATYLIETTIDAAARELGHRPGRAAPAQPRARVPVPDRARLDLRLRRLRALPRHARSSSVAAAAAPAVRAAATSLGAGTRRRARCGASARGGGCASERSAAVEHATVRRGEVRRGRRLDAGRPGPPHAVRADRRRPARRDARSG